MVQSPGQPAMLRTKLAISAAPFGGVHHLGMELHAIELAGVVGDGRERRAVGDRHGAEAVGEPGDAVAMAHPHRRPVPGAHTPWNSGVSATISSSARPNSRVWPPST